MASNNYHHHHQQASSTSSSSGAAASQQANGNLGFYQLPNGEYIAATNTIDLGALQWLNVTAAGAAAAAQNQQHQQQPNYLQQGQHLLNVIEQMPQQQHHQQHHVQQLQQQHQQVPVASSKASAKPRGRVTSYAFFVQTQHQEHQKKRPTDGINFKDFSRLCSEKWKGMTDEEKLPFHEMAENDKKRFDLEMKSWTPDPSLGQGGSKKRKKAPRDPDAPKRALSAFFLFCQDRRNEIKERNPNFTVGEVAKELGKLWADADPELKNKYKESAESAKLRYNEEFAEYQQKKTREANGDYSTSSHRSPETY